MATVLEGIAPVTDALDNYAGCSGDGGLWALAKGTPSDGAAFAQQLAALEQYPLPLREVIAARAGRNLMEVGRKVDFAALLDLLDRAPGKRAPELVLLRAELNADRDGAESALSDMSAVAEGDGPESARALLALAAARSEAHQRFDADFLAEVGAQAFLLRGTPIGDALLRQEILARIDVSGHAAALEQIAGSLKVAGTKTEKLRDLVAEVFQIATEDDIETERFLDLYFRHGHLLPKTASGDGARLAVAEHLREAAFPGLVEGVLDAALLRDVRDAKILAAKAALDMQRARAALSSINSFDGQDAALIRVQAYLQLADFSNALESTKSLQEAALNEVQLFWFQGSWPDSIAQDPAAAELYTMLQSAKSVGMPLDAHEKSIPPEPELSSLADFKAAFAGSQDARLALEARMSLLEKN